MRDMTSWKDVIKASFLAHEERTQEVDETLYRLVDEIYPAQWNIRIEGKESVV